MGQIFIPTNKVFSNLKINQHLRSLFQISFLKHIKNLFEALQLN
jgi:hypothetical protein